MPPIAIAIALAALGLAAAPGAAETVCRPSSLGAVRCSGPAARPEPRPIYRSDVQALDRVRQASEPADPGTTFVPARETNRLGTTLTEEPAPGRCRPDRLGNMTCR